MAAISQTTFSKAFSWVEMYEFRLHYSDVRMGEIASQITGLTIVNSIVYSGVVQGKHQSSASLAFVRGIHRRPMNSPHKWPVTGKKFPFDDVIMKSSLTFVPKVGINNIPAWVQIMAWRRRDDKPLSDPMIVSLLTDVYLRHSASMSYSWELYQCKSPWGTGPYMNISALQSVAIRCLDTYRSILCSLDFE